MRRIAATTALLAAATSAFSQARYEIGYEFAADTPVVEVRDEPFGIIVSSASGQQHLVANFPIAFDRRVGLVNVGAYASRESVPTPDLFSQAWAEVLFDDLEFVSASSEPIVVDVVLDYGVSTIAFGGAVEGTVFDLQLDLELGGDARAGLSRAIATGTGLRREYTGFLGGGIPIDKIIIVRAFDVPVNTPITFRLRQTKTLRLPAGDQFARCNFFEAEEFRDRCPGLVTGRDVFLVPDGVTVRSAQAGIRDNRFVTCLADYDSDSDLTLFDFLTFQNLFDAGDPLADFDADGSLTIFDFLAFQNVFDAGCP